MPPVAFEARQPPQVGEALATPRIFRVDSVSYVRSVAIRADFAALLRRLVPDDRVDDLAGVAIRADFAALLRLGQLRIEVFVSSGRNPRGFRGPIETMRSPVPQWDCSAVAIRADFAALLRLDLRAEVIHGFRGVAIRADFAALLRRHDGAGEGIELDPVAIRADFAALLRPWSLISFSVSSGGSQSARISRPY